MTGDVVEPPPGALGAILGAFEILRGLNTRTNSIVHYRAHPVGPGDPVHAVGAALRGRGREPGATAGWTVTLAKPLTSEAWTERLASWVGFSGDLQLADDPDPDDRWIGSNRSMTERLTKVIGRLLESAVGAPPLIVRPVAIEGPSPNRYWAIHGEAFLLEGAVARLLVDFGWSD